MAGEAETFMFGLHWLHERVEIWLADHQVILHGARQENVA